MESVEHGESSASQEKAIFFFSVGRDAKLALKKFRKHLKMLQRHRKASPTVGPLEKNVHYEIP